MKKYIIVSLILLVVASSITLLYIFYLKQQVYSETQPTPEICSEVLLKIKSGKFKEVEAYIDDLVNRKPFSIDGSRLLEDVYNFLSRRRDIIGYVNEWCESKSPHHAPFVIRGKYYIKQAWLERGSGWAYTVSDEMWRHFRGILSRAREDLEEAYNIEPNDPNSASSMITVCKGLSIDAEIMDQWFQKAIKADPCAIGAYANKLSYLFPKWHGSWDEAFEFSNRCYNSSPKNSIVYTTMYYFIMERTKRSKDRNATLKKKHIDKLRIDIFSRWNNDFPNSSNSHAYAGLLDYYLKEYHSAIREFSKAIEKDPNNRLALCQRAVCYRRYGGRPEWEKAEKDYMKVLSINPDDDFALCGLGDISSYLHQDSDQSIAYYNKAIKMNRREKSYFKKRAELKALKPFLDFKGAIDDCNAAIDLDRRYIGAYFKRGTYFYHINDSNKSEEDFKRVEMLIEEENIKGDAASISSIASERMISTINRIRCRTATSLTPQMAKKLTKGFAPILLNSLENLTFESAKTLKISETKWIDLNGLKSISPDAAAELSQHNGNLNLKGLKTISLDVAKKLGEHKGVLFLDGMNDISPEIAECLATKKQGLSLGGLKSITPEVAAKLAKLKGALYLKGIELLSPEAVAELAKLKGTLYLKQ